MPSGQAADRSRSQPQPQGAQGTPDPAASLRHERLRPDGQGHPGLGQGGRQCCQQTKVEGMLARSSRHPSFRSISLDKNSLLYRYFF